MNFPAMGGLDVAGLSAAGAYAGLLLVKTLLARRQILAEKRTWPSSVDPFGLTILQPILSGDETLEASLAESAALAENGAKLIWLVDEDDPEGQRIGRALQRPGIELVLCPAPNGGVNPKVSKLELAMERVDTEFVAVLDDDTAVGQRHLELAVACLRRQPMENGLYTGLPTYRALGGVGSRLVAGFVNSSSALTYLPPLALGSPITLNGMFYVTRASTLRSLGGFGAIRHELCDDLALARLFQRGARPIYQGATAQRLITGGMGLRDYWRRMHRWFVFASVLVRGVPRGQRAALGVLLGLPPILLWVVLVWGIGACLRGNWWPAAVVSCLLLFRQVVLAGLVRMTRERPSSGPEARVGPCVSIASELLQPFHVLHAALVPTIQWRTRRMKVRRDGTFESLDHG